MNTPARPHARRHRYLLRWLPLVVVAAALALGIIPRINASSAADEQTANGAVPMVTVTRPQAAQATQPVDLPGNVQAYQEADIYARTSGYVSHWYPDIGQSVRQGEVLATIDAPELDAELQQARAAEATALANYTIAKVTSDRWEELLKTNSVSRQQTEQFASTTKATQATLASASANVTRLAQLQSYEKVLAPFSGVVTARRVDTGALINAGSSAGASLFHLAQVDKLRVFIDVPQDESPNITPSTQARLSLPQYPGKVFVGQVVRSSGAINAQSRTLRVEVDVSNEGDMLLPGAYVHVQLLVTSANPTLSLPLNTLIFNASQPQVATVGNDGKVHLKNVQVGRDFGSQIEVTNGVTAQDQVVLNPNDAIAEGQAVKVSAAANGNAG